MEAQTRLAGLPLLALRHHGMDAKTTSCRSTKAESQACDAAQGIANGRIDALVKRYVCPRLAGAPVAQRSTWLTATLARCARSLSLPTMPIGKK